MPDPIEAAIAASLDAIRGDEPAESENPIFDEVVADDVPETEVVAPEVAAGDAPVVDKAVEGAEKPVIAKPAAVVNPDEEDDFSKIPAKDATGRTNRIPHPRVAKMVESSVKRAETKWSTERLQPVEAQNREYVQRLDQIAQVEDIMFSKPERMVDILRTIPGYTELFEKMSGGKAAAPAGGAPAVDPSDPEPQPDGRDAEGNIVGYTQEGLNKLRAWDRRQAGKIGADEAEKRLGSRLKPFEDSAKTRQMQYEQGLAISAELDTAAKWEGFIENSDEILKALKDDREEAVRVNPRNPKPKLTLLDAYHKVVWPKFRGNAQQIREQVIKELQGAPRSTSAGAGGGGTLIAKPPSSGDPIEDAIRNSLRKIRQ